MLQNQSVSLGNLVLSLSDTLDMAFPSLAAHQLRVAFIVQEMGRHAKLGRERCENLFLAGLLHDIGALSPEEKRAIHDSEFHPYAQHCLRGERLFRSNLWLAPAATLVGNHHRAWSTWESPRDIPVVVDSQILQLADDLERHINRSRYILHQNDELVGHLRGLAGKQIDTNVVDLFGESSRREEFWLNLTSPRLLQMIERDNALPAVDLNLENIRSIARLQSRIIDFKSSFTATHSAGVSCCASILARMAGMSGPDIELMEIAGLLHDLGKLVVPNAILEKPAKLTAAEMAVMKQHTYHTFSVLNSVPGFRTIAEWGAYHHERLTGDGYPFRRKADEITLGARIMTAADQFTALNEDRPYRRAMPLEEIRMILREQTARGIQDERIVRLLLNNMEDIRVPVIRKQEEARDFYRSQL